MLTHVVLFRLQPDDQSPTDLSGNAGQAGNHRAAQSHPEQTPPARNQASSTPPTPRVLDVVETLASLRNLVPGLLDLEVGANVLPSDRSYDIALIARFSSLEALEEYRVHPKHQEVLAYLRDRVERSLAVDYESQP